MGTGPARLRSRWPMRQARRGSACIGRLTARGDPVRGRGTLEAAAPVGRSGEDRREGRGAPGPAVAVWTRSLRSLSRPSRRKRLVTGAGPGGLPRGSDAGTASAIEAAAASRDRLRRRGGLDGQHDRGCVGNGSTTRRTARVRRRVRRRAHREGPPRPTRQRNRRSWPPDSEFTPVVHRLGCLRGISTLTGFALAVETRRLAPLHRQHDRLVRRLGPQRVLLRRVTHPGTDHQDRQRARPPPARRSGLAPPAPLPRRRCHASPLGPCTSCRPRPR